MGCKMNKKILKFAFSLLIMTAINAQWKSETAFTLEKGRKEISLFAPFRIGLLNSTELAINKFLLIIDPIPITVFFPIITLGNTILLAGNHTFSLI